MSWYNKSPNSWSASDYSHIQSFDMTTAQALNIVIENINCLISILRVPTDITSLKMDLNKSEYDRVSRHILETSRALNKIALDYRITSPFLSTPHSVKTEEELKISNPQTQQIVSSFEIRDVKEEFPRPYISTAHEGSQPSKNHSFEVEPAVDSECIAIGKAFDNLEDAAETFRRYALRCGFNICKGNSKKDVYQEYACSARGKVRVRKVADQVKRRNRKSIKKMCKCHIILRRKGDKWIITTRKLQHTHDLLTPEEIKRTAKNRYIPEDIKQKALDLYNAGEAPAKIQYQLENELGERCTWSMKDLYNMLYRFKNCDSKLGSECSDSEDS